jgi:hypothetical protein
VERTDSPWPQGLAPTVVLLLFYLGLFSEGMAIVRRYNRKRPGATLVARASARPSPRALHRAALPLMTGIAVVSCLLLVAVTWLAGLWDAEKWEPLALER